MGQDLFSQGLRALYNMVTDTHDFSQYEFVVPLPEVSENLDGETYVYAVSNNQVEFIAIDTEQLKSAEQRGVGNFIPLSALSESGIEAHQMDIRHDMASAISRAMDYTNPIDTGIHSSNQWLGAGDEIGPVPKDLETLSNLSRIMADHFEIADRPVTAGSFSDEHRQEAFETALGVESALHRGIADARIAMSLPDERDVFIQTAGEYFGDDFEKISSIIDPVAEPIETPEVATDMGQRG